jgi:hypothetical protein
LELLQRGGAIPTALMVEAPALDAEDVEDLEEAPDDEVEAAEEQILDQATAARTVAELKAEIETLKQLEGVALPVRRSGTDRKWRELANLLSEIFTPAAIASGLSEESMTADTAPANLPKASASQKLVIFTEHRDTLSYRNSASPRSWAARKPSSAFTAAWAGKSGRRPRSLSARILR